MTLAMGDPNNEDELLEAIRKEMRKNKVFKKNIADAVQQKNTRWLHDSVAGICKKVLGIVITKAVTYVIKCLSS